MATSPPPQTATAPRCSLRLYIAGNAPRSLRAVEALHSLCQRHLGDHFDLEVIDIYQQPARAREDDVLVAPTVVRERPTPRRRHVGALADEDRVAAALGLDLVCAAPLEDA